MLDILSFFLDEIMLDILWLRKYDDKMPSVSFSFFFNPFLLWETSPEAVQPCPTHIFGAVEWSMSVWVSPKIWIPKREQYCPHRDGRLEGARQLEGAAAGNSPTIPSSIRLKERSRYVHNTFLIVYLLIFFLVGFFKCLFWCGTCWMLDWVGSRKDGYVFLMIKVI